MKDEPDLTTNYREKLLRLARVLYDRDPYAMGSSIGAPEDEYLPVAQRLMPLLSGISDREELARVLSENRMPSDALLADVWEIFNKQSL